MKIVLFYHSLVSDWNHGNAHFLRGVATELIKRGHNVVIYEPENGWSRQNLIAEHGEVAIHAFHVAYSHLHSIETDLAQLDLDSALADADLVIVHEWNEPELVGRIGAHHAAHPRYALYFHDTHHRSVTKPEEIARYDLSGYDAVLAYGNAIRDEYLKNKWAHSAYTWHEAADVSVFHPRSEVEKQGDLVWIGNWGDGERTAELDEFLIQPVAHLGLKAAVYGVGYDDQARAALARAGIEYRGWLPNFEVPAVFAAYRVTVHIPRRPYASALPGIPTIRPFEAMACGIPLVCAPWNDAEHLFTPGEDYLVAENDEGMIQALRRILNDPPFAQSVAQHGLRTIQARHTCYHRADELLTIMQRDSTS